MTKTEIIRLIETQDVELKKSLSEKKAGLEALNAMANSDLATGQLP